MLIKMPGYRSRWISYQIPSAIERLAFIPNDNGFSNAIALSAHYTYLSILLLRISQLELRRMRKSLCNTKRTSSIIKHSYFAFNPFSHKPVPAAYWNAAEASTCRPVPNTCFL